MDQYNENEKETADLGGALKDSGTGVKFEDSGWRPKYGVSATPKIIQWTMKYSGGLVQNEKQATWVVFGFVMAMIAVSSVLFSSISSPQGNTGKLSPAPNNSPAQYLP